ncbi:hypothetical protein QJQ45_003971 [Haematococcus lacustris]|nr:hypothetical protein QJQ45_003971 [Haematococcus lacustris]
MALEFCLDCSGLQLKLHWNCNCTATEGVAATHSLIHPMGHTSWHRVVWLLSQVKVCHCERVWQQLHDERHMGVVRDSGDHGQLGGLGLEQLVARVFEETDEHRQAKAAPDSSQEASELGPSTPPPAKRIKAEQVAEPTQPIEGKAKAKPAPQPGRWVARDCNAALNMQRIGESRWRPLELCWWPDLPELPAKGKGYPELGFKRLRDSAPKAQQQQQQAAAQYTEASSTLLDTLELDTLELEEQVSIRAAKYGGGARV